MQLKRIMALATTVLLALSLANTSGFTTPLSEPFRFPVIGESAHWVVILYNDGQFAHGRLEDLYVRPWIIWAGGGDTPAQYVTMYKLRDATCRRGGHPKGPKLQVSSYCQLVSQGHPSLAVKTPEELQQLVVAEGRFTVEWNGNQETVSFR